MRVCWIPREFYKTAISQTRNTGAEVGPYDEMFYASLIQGQ